MATTFDPKEDAEINTTSHLETLSDSEKHHISHEEEILGRDFTVAEDDLPAGYFKSANFLGSSMLSPLMLRDTILIEPVFAIGASFGCGVGGFGLAAPVLAFINADIGPDPNLSWVALSYLLTNSIGLMLVGRLSDLFGTTFPALCYAYSY